MHHTVSAHVPNLNANHPAMPASPAKLALSFRTPASRHPSEKLSLGKVVNAIRTVGGIAGRVANTAGKVAIIASMI